MKVAGFNLVLSVLSAAGRGQPAFPRRPGLRVPLDGVVRGFEGDQQTLTLLGRLGCACAAWRVEGRLPASLLFC